jgi:hypothetical protein
MPSTTGLLCISVSKGLPRYPIYDQTISLNSSPTTTKKRIIPTLFRFSKDNNKNPEEHNSVIGSLMIW